jgi:peptide/nickel transport system substrate-binding protein
VQGPLSERTGYTLSRRSMLKIAGIGAIASTTGLLAACNGDDDLVDDEVDAVEPDDDEDEPAVDPDDDEDEVDDPDDDPDVVDDEEVDDDEADDDEVDDDEVDPGEGQMGGTINFAGYSEPPTVDGSWTTAIVVQIPSIHVFESLMAYDEEWVAQPMLCDEAEVSDDGLNVTFHLREGVNFHNGDVMDADDVVASIERWMSMAGNGQDTAPFVDSVEATDELSVQIQLNSSFAPLLNYMSSPLGYTCIIVPAEIAEETMDDRLGDDQYIGTGPYQFVEHVPDQHILVERFEDYSSRDDDPSNYAGAKTAYADQIRFVTVPDASARIAGVEGGDYHWAEEVTRDDFERLQEDDNVQAEILSPLRWKGIIFNKERGPFTDPNLRRAVLYALDMEEIMFAAFGDEEFWRIDHSLLPEETVWWSEVGQDEHNIMDLDQARQLVEDSDYDGEEIRWMSPSDREDYYAVALTAVPMLQEIGLNVEVLGVDWGTVVDRRTDPDEWEIFNTGFGFGPEPTTVAFIPADWPGWWTSEEKEAALQAVMEETEQEAREELWDEFQQVFYDDVPVIKVGDFFALTIYRSELHGGLVAQEPRFWNAWLEE